jgi:hypothetical protein
MTTNLSRLLRDITKYLTYSCPNPNRQLHKLLLLYPTIAFMSWNFRFGMCSFLNSCVDCRKCIYYKNYRITSWLTTDILREIRVFQNSAVFINCLSNASNIYVGKWDLNFVVASTWYFAICFTQLLLWHHHSSWVHGRISFLLGAHERQRKEKLPLFRLGGKKWTSTLGYVLCSYRRQRSSVRGRGETKQ